MVRGPGVPQHHAIEAVVPREAGQALHAQAFAVKPLQRRQVIGRPGHAQFGNHGQQLGLFANQAKMQSPGPTTLLQATFLCAKGSSESPPKHLLQTVQGEYLKRC